ncbi:MAG: SDR family oxidoreductase [Caulobacterales bacterium]|nr:SDR family oxidoreductase [Caulobacterales bacterium]MCA0372105.1 SDR family oxidoreductase [Pseudomonadota bacterium]
MNRRTCLITGASAGIGKEFAQLMAQRGYDLILTARREDRLIEIADNIEKEWGAKSLIIKEDLAIDGAVDRILAKIRENNLNVDALINNAGYGLPGTFASTNWQEQKDFLNVLLNAPTELAHKLVPQMKENGFGRIINVASLAGHIPGSAGHTLYGAVKSYMIKFSQSLNSELEGSGVNVSALCPGFTYSEFHDVNHTRDLVSKMPKYMWQDARSVVEEGFEAVEDNKAVAVTGFNNKLIAALFKIMPDFIAQKIVKARSKDFRHIETK